MRGADYAAVHGPTVGDTIALGDTGLVVRVEADAQRRGEEFLLGFGKTARDGMHLAPVSMRESCDLVVSNVVILDAVLGVRKASIGVRDGRVVAIGRAGNPDTLDGVDVVVGTGTAVISGEGLIATSGAIDTHVHLMSPRIMEASLSSGVTTILGQEYGPIWGVGVNDRYGVHRGWAAFDAWPVNIGFLGRGSSSRPAPLVEALVHAGACGFKVHEDIGAHPRALDTALRVADEHDVQVAVHTDGLNESMFVRDTLAVIDGRTIHAFHVEGCGGGHVPDVLTLAGVPNVIGSSTNPTMPFGRDAVDEHLAMIMSVHGLKPDLPGDLAIARDRIRSATMAAEDVLHDLGSIPIMSSDAQGMGRAGETVARTFATAGLMKQRLRRLGNGDELVSPDGDDNARVLRYLAKLTINPAIAHGLSDEIGTLTPGRLADIVLWDPAWFGVKPILVLKAGFPAWGVTGDPNATIDTAEPLVYGPEFGGHGSAPADLGVAFVSQACSDAGEDRLPTRRRRVPVHGCRGIGLADMVRNTRTGVVDVDHHTSAVTLDGRPLTAEPAERSPLTRLYLL
ncbi:MAG TPA: urease subunit alpha [Mycobacterium sp.]|nr:urease subunit alpha [Mycobacterium sp.]